MKVRSRPAHWPTATLVGGVTLARSPRSPDILALRVIDDAAGARDVPARGGLTRSAATVKRMSTASVLW
jgi:hypothetical protein